MLSQNQAYNKSPKRTIVITERKKDDKSKRSSHSSKSRTSPDIEFLGSKSSKREKKSMETIHQQAENTRKPIEVKREKKSPSRSTTSDHQRHRSSSTNTNLVVKTEHPPSKTQYAIESLSLLFNHLFFLGILPNLRINVSHWIFSFQSSIFSIQMHLNQLHLLFNYLLELKARLLLLRMMEKNRHRFNLRHLSVLFSMMIPVHLLWLKRKSFDKSLKRNPRKLKRRVLNQRNDLGIQIERKRKITPLIIQTVNENVWMMVILFLSTKDIELNNLFFQIPRKRQHQAVKVLRINGLRAVGEYNDRIPNKNQEMMSLDRMLNVVQILHHEMIHQIENIRRNPNLNLVVLVIRKIGMLHHHHHHPNHVLIMIDMMQWNLHLTKSNDLFWFFHIINYRFRRSTYRRGTEKGKHPGENHMTFLIDRFQA